MTITIDPSLTEEQRALAEEALREVRNEQFPQAVHFEGILHHCENISESFDGSTVGLQDNILEKTAGIRLLAEEAMREIDRRFEELLRPLACAVTEVMIDQERQKSEKSHEK